MGDKKTKKLSIDRTTIATLTRKSLLLAVGGAPRAPATPRPSDGCAEKPEV